MRSRGLTWLPIFAHPTIALRAASIISRDLMHRQCGHLHEIGLLKLDKLGVDGMWGFSILPPLSFCAVCAIGKSKVSNIERLSPRDSDPPTPFHIMALDIWGPMSTEDIGGGQVVLGRSLLQDLNHHRQRHEAQVLCHLHVEINGLQRHIPWPRYLSRAHRQRHCLPLQGIHPGLQVRRNSSGKNCSLLPLAAR